MKTGTAVGKTNFGTQLSGQMGRDAFSSFLEFLSVSHFSGNLHLRGPDISEVMLIFKEGKLSAARGQVMHKLFVGLNAFTETLRWSVVEIITQPQYFPNLGPDAFINISLTEAILQSSRQIDQVLEDQHLPSQAKLQPREQLAAYARLGMDEQNVYQRIKQLRRVQADVHVMDIHREMPGMEVDVLLRRLMRRGLLVLELGKTTEIIMSKTEVNKNF